MKATLVRNGNHMRPMLAVLERYGIGAEDKYGRGRWITPGDLKLIAEKMQTDPSKIDTGTDLYVKGTCQHNHVRLQDYRELFI